MPPRQLATKPRSTRNGLSQLTLVEHSLCPLDAQASLKDNFSHSSAYRFTDAEGKTSTARAKIAAYEGLSANDEFYLWGLLGITFAQNEPTFDLHATPHYCLRQLGMVEGKSKGGKDYRLFREAVRRLSAVRYQNDRFWDPVKREHRQVSFGFFSYSLPINPESGRAWRIAWDPVFFDICRAAGSQLGFDLDLYRGLDVASRRLFLLLKKVFWRRERSPLFDLRQLAVDVLGFSPEIDVCDLKKKVRRAAGCLVEKGIVQPAIADSPWFVKRAKGVYAVQFVRGPNADARQAIRTVSAPASPLYDPLKSIGFDDQMISRLLKQYSPPLIQLWSDITLAAIEHQDVRFFRRSPQAFFIDSIRHAARGTRTAPDWFHEIRREEERCEVRRQQKLREKAPEHKPAGVERAASPGLSKAIEATGVEDVVRSMLGVGSPGDE